MEGYLDLSQCDEKVRKPFDKVGLCTIPIKWGKHEMDFDVDMDKLNDNQKAFLDRETTKRGKNYRRDWPIGFQLYKLPDKAVLHVKVEKTA